MKLILRFLLTLVAGFLIGINIHDYNSGLELAAALLCVFVAGWMQGTAFARANTQ